MVAKVAIAVLGFMVMMGGGWRAYATPAIVDYVIDGDTFGARVLLDDGVRITVRVRIANVDTPELHGVCDYEVNMANMARNRLAELLPVGAIVELKNIRDDKYLGRIDALVYDADGNNIGQMLIDEKFGRPYDGGRRMGWCK